METLGPPKIEPKSLKFAKKHIKFDAQKKHVFQHMFFLIFRRFDLRKSSRNRIFWDIFSKTSILLKSCSRRGESMIFEVRRFQKTTKMRSRNALEKKVGKNVAKIDFGFHFACQKLPQNPRNLKKSTKIAIKKSFKNKSYGPQRQELCTSTPRAATHRDPSLLGPRPTIKPPFQ